MSRPPAPPVYFFLLDVSQEAVKSGMLEMTVHVIKDTISKDLLLGGPRTMVFISMICLFLILKEKPIIFFKHSNLKGWNCEL